LWKTDSLKLVEIAMNNIKFYLFPCYVLLDGNLDTYLTKQTGSDLLFFFFDIYYCFWQSIKLVRFLLKSHPFVIIRAMFLHFIMKLNYIYYLPHAWNVSDIFFLWNTYQYLEQTTLLTQIFSLFSLPTGPSFCNKPVLKTMVPPACPTHHQFGERCLARALRRAGLGNAIPSNRKPTVKLHVLVSEFVHQIQNKRKLALKETAPKVETE